MTDRERIMALAKEIQSEGRYGTINIGSDRYPDRVAAYPFVVLGLLMAVEVLDGEEIR